MLNYRVIVNKNPAQDSNIKAFATVIFEDVLSVSGFKVVEGKNGFFVSHPQHKGKDKDGNDKYYDDVKYVIEDTDKWKAATSELHQAILQAYEGESKPASKPSGNDTRAKVAQTQTSRTGNSRARVTDMPF